MSMLLEKMPSEFVPEAAASAEAWEQPNERALRQLGKVVGIERLDQTGLSQNEVTDYFEETVYDAIRQAWIERNAKMALPRRSEQLDAELGKRLEDISYSLAGLSLMEIGRKTGRSELTVKANIRLTFGALRYEGSPYTPEYFRNSLFESYPNARLAPKPSPAAPNARRPRIGLVAAAIVHSEQHSDPEAAQPHEISAGQLAGTAAVAKVVALPKRPRHDALERAFDKQAESGSDEVLPPAEKQVVGGDPDLVRMYLNDAAKTKLLTAEQEVDLAKQIEAGLYAGHLLARNELTRELSDKKIADLKIIRDEGVAARTHFIKSNTLLAVSLAKNYTGRGVPLTDLIQEANLGLIRAVDKFDYKKGYKFSGYAGIWINQFLKRGVPKLRGTIHLPVDVAEDVTKLKAAHGALLRGTGQEPNNAQLAAATGVAEAKIPDLLAISQEPLSLTSPVGDSDGAEFGDYIADEEYRSVETQVVESDKLAQIDKALRGLREVEGLDERAEQIMRLHFGFVDDELWAFTDIARELGMSIYKVKEIVKRSQQVMREKDEETGNLRTYA